MRVRIPSLTEKLPKGARYWHSSTFSRIAAARVRFRTAADSWIAFHVQSEPDAAKVFVAPIEAEPPLESRWIPIAAAPGGNIYPFWSPDGKLLYFVSNRDGFSCVWAQPLDRASGRPVGPPRDVLHLHSATRSLAHVRMGVWGFSLARDRLVFSLGEKTGNLWELSPYR